MPTVPRLDGPQVRTEALPGVRVNTNAGDAEAFGGGASLDAATTAARNTAQIGEKIAIQAKQNADEVRFMDADLQLSKLQTQNELNAKKMQGKDAAGALDAVDKDWTKGVEEVMKGLSNNEQRAAVSRAAKVRYSEMNKSVQSHMINEAQKLDTSTTADYVATAQNDAALNSHDPSRIKLSIYQQEQAIIGYGHRTGQSKENITKALQDARSNTHSAVIEAMLGSGQIDAAKAYYNENKKQLVGSKIDSEYIKTKSKAVIEQAKYEQEKAYDENYRTAMLDLFDRRMTLSELQRRYRAGAIKESDYNTLESKLVKAEYTEAFKEGFSDPRTFNEIRSAQLSGSKTKREILDMINKATSSGKLATGGKAGDDATYLTNLTNDTPASPRDQRIDSQANTVRDFGVRYAGKPSLLEYITQKDAAQGEARKAHKAEALVNEFLRRVDDQKADGDRVGEIANEVMREFIKKDHPEVGRMEDLPHVIVDVNGKVQRLLNPDQKTKQKPSYKITPLPPPVTPEKKAKK